MADGSIIFDTSLDNKQLEKELNRLHKKIQNLNDSIYTKQQQQIPLVRQAEELEIALENAKVKLAEMQSGTSFYTSDSITSQIQNVKEIQKEYEGVQRRVMQYDNAIEKANIELDLTKRKAGAAQQEIAAAGDGADAMADAVGRAEAYMNKFTNRIKRLATRVFVFTLITQALRSMRTWMGKVIKTNDEVAKAIAQLKGALLTLAQPIVNVVIPVFTTLVNVLTRLVSAAASAISALFGTTAQQSAESAESLYEETEAMEGVGTAAKKAEKSMAGFDTINQLSFGGSDESGGTATADSAKEIAPDFSFLDLVDERLDKIAKSVALIGTGLALWKIGSALPGMLGKIATKLGGILITVGGLILELDGLKDAWENGLDWGNMAEIIGGAAAAVLGLYLAFGKTGAAIGLLVEGFVLVVTGIHDMMENGMNLQNLITTISGLLSAGVGIGILTKNWIPLAVAAIASVLLAITHLAGEGDNLISGLKDIFGGFADFINGVFTGDMEKAGEGLKRIWKGTWNSILAIVGSVVNFIIDGINWLISKINSALQFDIPDWVPAVGGKSFSPNIKPLTKWDIPYLAQGAVIPPNREFLAVLGDQSHGSNIEAPESLLRQIAREESGAGNEQMIVLLRAILEAVKDGKVLEVDGQRFARLSYRAVNGESNRVGMKLVNT